MVTKRAILKLAFYTITFTVTFDLTDNLDNLVTDNILPVIGHSGMENTIKDQAFTTSCTATIRIETEDGNSSVSGDVCGLNVEKYDQILVNLDEKAKTLAEKMGAKHR